LLQSYSLGIYILYTEDLSLIIVPSEAQIFSIASFEDLLRA